MSDAPLSEIVSLTITTNEIGIQRESFGIPLILSVNATWAERVRVYEDMDGVAADWPSTGPEYLAANAIFAQDPAPASIMIGRAVGKPTLAYGIGVTTAAAGSTYEIDVAGYGITPTVCTYTPGADLTLTVNIGTSSFLATAHGMTTGDGPYRYLAATTYPTGLAADTDYYVIVTDANDFKLATSKANAIAGTSIALTGSAVGAQTLQRSDNDVIISQLVVQLNAVAGKNYTAAQVSNAGETDTMTVTANTAGAYFSLSANPYVMSSLMTHTEPTPNLATDLAAINLENSTWYALYTLYNSDGYAKSAASWTEANGKIYICDLVDSRFATAAAGGSDTAQALATLGYKRTATNYHPTPAEMAGAAWLGSRLPYDPGTATYKFAELAGVDAVNTTSTFRTNIRAKNGNVYIPFAGLSIMVEGTMVNAGFIDNQIGIDCMSDDVSKSVFEVLAGVAKVPFTDAGIAIVVSALRASLKRMAAQGIINDDFTITFPKASDVSSSNKGLRILPNIKFQCELQGAVHRVQINGVVSV